MKKTLMLLLFAAVVAFSAVPARAISRPQSLPSSLPSTLPAINTDAALEALKTAYTKAVNQILAMIDSAQAYLAGVKVPEGYACSVSPALQSLEDYLRGQLTKVNQAQSLAEIKTIVQSTVTYLKENKTAITNSVNAYADCAYNASVQAINAYLTYAQAQSLVLKAKGEDVTQLQKDIAAASDLVKTSQSQYAAAKTTKEKSAAYKTLAQTAPYLESIAAALQ